MNTPLPPPPAPLSLADTRRQDRPVAPPRFWRRYRGRLVGAAAAMTALIVLVVTWSRMDGVRTSVERSRVSISTVERGSFVRDVAAEGQVVAAASPTLYAPAAGNVSLKVHAGDPVGKDQVLAVIDSPDLTARLSQEQATLESLRMDWERARLDAGQKLAQLRAAYSQAEIDRHTAERELARSRKALELGSYSELQVLRAEGALEKAQFADEQAKLTYESQPAQNRFEVDSKKALLERQQYLVADLRRQVNALQIRSPVEGKVGQVQIDDRASVARDTPLLTVVDLTTLEVEIKVAESLARDLTSGMSADLEGDGHHWKGIVSGVSPQVVDGQVVARLRFGEEKPRGLRQNQRLAVRIFIDRREHVLMVDRGPFLDEEGGGFVYVVRGKVAERRAVRLGAASVQKVEILEGLVAGDQIVVSGTDAFNGAQRVLLSN